MTEKMVGEQKIDEIKNTDNPDGAAKTGTTALTGFMKQFTAAPAKVKEQQSSMAADQVVDEKQAADVQEHLPQTSPTQDLERLTKKYGDKEYKQVDGLYIIYKGKVDIVNPQN